MKNGRLHILSPMVAQNEGILQPIFSDIIYFVVIVYFGGRGMLVGGFGGWFTFIRFTVIFMSNFDYLPGFNLVIFGLMVFPVMLYLAGGMAQFFEYLVDKWKDNPTVRWLTT